MPKNWAIKRLALSVIEDSMPVWTHLPNFPFTPLILTEIPLITGMNPDRVRPIKSIPKFKPRPILFIAGDADDTIPMANSQQLFQKAANPNAELWVVPEAKHVGAYTVQPNQYLQKISEFFSNNLR